MYEQFTPSMSASKIQRSACFTRNRQDVPTNFLFVKATELLDFLSIKFVFLRFAVASLLFSEQKSTEIETSSETSKHGDFLSQLLFQPVTLDTLYIVSNSGHNDSLCAIHKCRSSLSYCAPRSVDSCGTKQRWTKQRKTQSLVHSGFVKTENHTIVGRNKFTSCFFVVLGNDFCTRLSSRFSPACFDLKTHFLQAEGSLCGVFAGG